MTKTDFAQRLERLGITQAEAARVLHRTKGTIAKWHHGRAQPDPLALAYLEVIEHAQGVIRAVRRQSRKSGDRKAAA